ncbi:putative bifunctional diguanylate cyclase/phosphodiesterase [Thalassotalea sp. PLHSN55]|uniref:putative bifunctional diguanylate cyclase/phosphodiesterase n=1 Tax=Thalassotalea sp. PLHSN55 TaxID=3435888 RepID=UPI003F84CA80
MTITDLSSGLRNRLLFTSVALAMVVSTIFIYVAFNLSQDLGESLELDHNEHLLQALSQHIQDEISSVDTKNVNLSENINADLVRHLDLDIVGAEIWFNNQHIKLKVDDSYNKQVDLVAAVNSKKTAQGTITKDDTRLFWSYHTSPVGKYSILLVRKTHALDKALALAKNRLSITAFLTFWLLVWAALILSALVTKRFEQGNARLHYLATHDVLTGLGNRAYLYQYAQHYFSAEQVNKHKEHHTLLALYVIDLDKFKDINDTMGHLTGDELLKTIADRLNKVQQWPVKVIRFGGDEFVVWCDGINEQQAVALAEEIVHLCRQPIDINGYVFETSVSVGFSFYPTSGLRLDTLLKNADIAMYQAKKHRLGFQVFQQELFSRSEFRVNLRGQLNKALMQRQFILHYQPKVLLPDKNMIGVEALVRWQHPKEGLLMPQVFIDLIEQSMFVHEFTRYVLQQAICQCRCWLDSGIEMPIAVNISPYNLMDPKLVSYLSEMLIHYQVPPHMLELELTENASMVNIDKTIEVFGKLRALGVKLAIDDFGTGMSSLAYIKQLDVDYIKIDRSFIVDLVTDQRDEAVMVSMFVLCQKLGKLIVAEGVETIEQETKLKSLGCNIVQGYLYSRPISAQDVVKGIYKQQMEPRYVR